MQVVRLQLARKAGVARRQVARWQVARKVGVARRQVARKAEVVRKAVAGSLDWQILVEEVGTRGSALGTARWCLTWPCCWK